MVSVRFEDPYYHINPTDNANDETHLISENEGHIIEEDDEEGIFEYMNENTITKE